MKLSVLNSIDDVVSRQLCAGCGACAGLEPAQFEMVDVDDHGRRPQRRADAPRDPDALARAWQACPGRALEHDFDRHDPELIDALTPEWGPVLAVYEGWATDDAIRHRGSSGGAATALALAALETKRAGGVMHTAARTAAPLLNHTVISRSREALLARTGSRYAPASPCDRLHELEQETEPVIFIGKPCDVAAVRRAERVRPQLRDQIAATIGIFCAGTPTTRATRRLLASIGVEHVEDVRSVRYRGDGWPGEFVATVRTEHGTETRTLSYEASWGALTNDKPWRCHVCADHTGEFADIAVGDPWYRPVEPGEPGRSLIVVRTERGRALLQHAVTAGTLTVEVRDPSILPASQPNLLRGRGAVWARRLACRLAGVPVPRQRGLPMFRAWWQTLTWRERAQSFLGTFRRIARRGLRHPVTITADTAPPPRLRLHPGPASTPSSPSTEAAPQRRAA